MCVCVRECEMPQRLAICCQNALKAKQKKIKTKWQEQRSSSAVAAAAAQQHQHQQQGQGTVEGAMHATKCRRAPTQAGGRQSLTESKARTLVRVTLTARERERESA